MITIIICWFFGFCTDEKCEQKVRKFPSFSYVQHKIAQMRWNMVILNITANIKNRFVYQVFMMMMNHDEHLINSIFPFATIYMEDF